MVLREHRHRVEGVSTSGHPLEDAVGRDGEDGRRHAERDAAPTVPQQHEQADPRREERRALFREDRCREEQCARHDAARAERTTRHHGRGARDERNREGVDANEVVTIASERIARDDPAEGERDGGVAEDVPLPVPPDRPAEHGHRDGEREQREKAAAPVIEGSELLQGSEDGEVDRCVRERQKAPIGRAVEGLAVRDAIAHVEDAALHPLDVHRVREARRDHAQEPHELIDRRQEEDRDAREVPPPLARPEVRRLLTHDCSRSRRAHRRRSSAPVAVRGYAARLTA
ncbi:MAG: hypothetical protein JWP97_2528 [Labilithrix sp.]|nr:hypothetical protein [Labilithrix sp.]